MGQQGVLRALEEWVCGQQGRGLALGGVEGAGVVHEVGDL